MATVRALATRRRVLIAIVSGVAAAAVAVLTLPAIGDDADVVVYNGRSQYGDEPAFRAYARETGETVELRGGTAPELYERLSREGAETPADLLVTTDLANLWRAEQADLLQPVSTPRLRARVPPALRAREGAWWGISVRIRTPVRSTERVPESAIRGYEDLGDPRWKGRLCLRTSNNEYNQSFVADRIAKRGAGETERMLRRWIANRPTILGSDVDVLEAIAAGRCDVGLVNHYYLARILAERPRFPVAPAWPDQAGRGAHANLSGVGLVKGARHRANAVRLMEYLTAPEAQREIARNGELPANPAVPPAPPARAWARVKLDPIDVDRAGALLPEAVALMERVGWR
mgnify:FL=1